MNKPLYQGVQDKACNITVEYGLLYVFDEKFLIYVGGYFMKSKKGLLFVWCWGALGKSIISCFIIATMLLSLFIINVSADDSKISIYVNEKELQCDVLPFIENGRTMVPMRKLFEALNADVEWDNATQTVFATKGNDYIALQINVPVLYKNNISEILDVAPMIVNGVTFVPIRAVSQSLNSSVDWLDYTQTVYINSPTLYAEHKKVSAETVTLMYAADGRTMYVANSEVEAYQNVGWYLEPVTMMYAADGRTIYVANSEVEAYKNVGWYLTPVTTMYAPDGRSIVVSQDEITAYQNVGWYKTRAQAQAAAKPANSSSNNSSYKPSNNNKTNSGNNKTIKTSHKEHNFWAEEGAVIVSFDPLSTVVKYKDKCPVCGKIGNGTHTTSITGSKHNSNATCSNSKCSNKGKSFKVVIGHSTINVDD